METYLQKLLKTNILREPVLRAAIQRLELPPGSQGLDAGCGLGLQASLLAEAVGPAGRVIGLDKSPEFVDYARGLFENSPWSAQVSFQVGEVNHLPFNDHTFHWVWSADCVGYPAHEPVPLMQELARVVKPGGRVALLMWASQLLLPGYPLLEARLNATSAGIAPFVPGQPPEWHWLRALGWLRQAGLKDATAHTLVGTVQAPLHSEIRQALIALFNMRWGEAQPQVTAEDWATYQRLSQSDSPDFILNQPDYYAFFTYTLFQARVANLEFS